MLVNLPAYRSDETFAKWQQNEPALAFTSYLIYAKKLCFQFGQIPGAITDMQYALLIEFS